MTEKQLNALRNYIWTVCEFIVERRLNPYGPRPSSWETELFEKEFEEIMLKDE